MNPKSIYGWAWGFVLSSFIWGGSYARAQETKISVQEVRAIYTKVRSLPGLKVQFQQKSITSLRGKVRTRTGVGYFDAKGKFRWQLETPFKEYKIFDGTQFFEYAPEDKLAVRYKTTSRQAKELSWVVEAVLNPQALLEEYDWKDQPQLKDGKIYFSLKAKKSREVSQMDLVLQKETGYLMELTFYLVSKNKLSHVFSTHEPQTVPEVMFTLPKDVSIKDHSL